MLSGMSPRFTLHVTLTRSPCESSPKVNGVIAGGTAKDKQRQARESRRAQSTVDAQRGRVRRRRHQVARHASVVAAVARRQGADRQAAGELVQVPDQQLGVRLAQRPAVLQPADVERWVALGHHALQTHPFAQVQVGAETERV